MSDLRKEGRVAKGSPAGTKGLIKVLKKFSASKVQLTADEKARFERMRLAEEQAKKVEYELGGPISEFF